MAGQFYNIGPYNTMKLLDPAAVWRAMLLKASYTFSPAHATTDVVPQEVTASGYTRPQVENISANDITPPVTAMSLYPPLNFGSLATGQSVGGVAFYVETGPPADDGQNILSFYWALTPVDTAAFVPFAVDFTNSHTFLRLTAT